jgi:hypothetical protein
VVPQGLELAAVQHTRARVLRRGPGGGARPPWQA